MTKKIYYEKIGNEYHPVSEYNSDFMDSLPKGSHLIMCYPGGKSCKHNVDPDYAGLIAASRVAEDAMCDAISAASALRPKSTPITEGQRRAWKKLAKEFGDELYALHGPCVRDIAKAGIKALQHEASLLYSNTAVRNAYDHFVLLCTLTKKETDVT